MFFGDDVFQHRIELRCHLLQDVLLALVDDLLQFVHLELIVDLLVFNVLLQFSLLGIAHHVAVFVELVLQLRDRRAQVLDAGLIRSEIAFELRDHGFCFVALTDGALHIDHGDLHFRECTARGQQQNGKQHQSTNLRHHGSP